MFSRIVKVSLLSAALATAVASVIPMSPFPTKTAAIPMSPFPTKTAAIPMSPFPTKTAV